MGLIDNIKSYSKQVTLSPEKTKLLKSFFEKGFPTIKDEEWKYTSLKKITTQNFSIEQNGSTFNKSEIQNYSLGFKNKLIFIKVHVHLIKEISAFFDFISFEIK